MNITDRIIPMYRGGKSSRAIAQELECSHSKVLYCLKENGIKARTISEALRLRTKHLEPSELLREIVDGLMLGDGSLKVQSTASGNIILANKSKQFIEFTRKLLERCEVRCRTYINKGGYFFLETLSYDLFRLEYQRWYPIKKEIPKDLKLSPLIVTLWYLGDGSISKTRYEGTRMICHNAKFHTDCFSAEDIDFLIELFRQVGIESHRYTASRKYYEITIGAKAIPSLFSYMLPCPIDEMIYKWPTPQMKSLTQRQQQAIDYRRKGYTPKITAQKMGITPVAVYYLLRNAQKLLNGDEVFPKMKPGPSKES